MSFIFRVYNITDKEVIRKTNEIREKAEKMSSIPPTVFICSSFPIVARSNPCSFI